MRNGLIFALLLGLTFSTAHAGEPVAALPATMPDGAKGEAVKLGLNIFKETKKYAPEFVGNGLACKNCHLGVGTVENAAPLTGLQGVFPEYSERAGRKISLQERINSCFLYSMNGAALPHDSKEMAGLIAFIGWIADPAKKAGRGIPELAGNPTGDAEWGRGMFAEKCAVCHGEGGAGTKEGTNTPSRRCGGTTRSTTAPGWPGCATPPGSSKTTCPTAKGVPSPIRTPPTSPRSLSASRDRRIRKGNKGGASLRSVEQKSDGVRKRL